MVIHHIGVLMVNLAMKLGDILPGLVLSIFAVNQMFLMSIQEVAESAILIVVGIITYWLEL